MTRTTENLIHSYSWDNRLEEIPVERFTREMQKAMAGTCPVRFFTRMLELHVGAGYLPELFRIPAIPAGPLQHHPEGDLFSHCCQVLERMSLLSTDPLARFCAFFHDLGKLATNSDHYPKHHGHNEAGIEIARQFCDRLKLPATWKRALAWTNGLHGHANRWEELRDATKIRMAEQAVKAGIVEILPLVSAADKPRSHVMPGWETAIRVAGMNAEELGIAPLQLEMMKPENRGAFILQKQVEVYRKMQ
jgi:tRNA nucleotidyltransferase (CCA-adding enzyme)